MIIHDGTFMNPNTFCYLCKKLIRIKVCILFLKSHVVPCNVLCLINVTRFHICFFQSHGWKVIPEHHKYGVLVSFLQLFDEVCNKAVCLMQLVYIIGPLIVCFLTCTTCCNVNRIFNHWFCWIIPMGTNCNCIGEICLFWCCIQTLDSLTHKNIVCCPVSIWCIFCNVHQLFTCKGIKSHHGKCIGTAVEITSVVVNHMGSITNL